MARKHSLTQNQVIQRITDIHGCKYDLSNVVFKTIDDKITLICPTHGEFQITPRSIFHQRAGCTKCSYHDRGTKRRKTLSQFLYDASVVHGDRYDYSLVTEYTNNKTKVPIFCREHGLFHQTPDNHINNKQGCPLCNTGNGKGGYSHAYFQHNPDEQVKPGILYAAVITNGNERSVKIGITATTTHRRFSRSEYKNMNIQVLHERHTTLYEAFCLEQYALQSLADHRFFTNSPFSGHTECFRSCEEVDMILAQLFINMIQSPILTNVATNE